MNERCDYLAISTFLHRKSDGLVSMIDWCARGGKFLVSGVKESLGVFFI